VKKLIAGLLVAAMAGIGIGCEHLPPPDEMREYAAIIIELHELRAEWEREKEEWDREREREQFERIREVLGELEEWTRNN